MVAENQRGNLSFLIRQNYFFVISDQNINYPQLSEVMKRQGKKKCSETYILTKNIHPTL